MPVDIFGSSGTSKYSNDDDSSGNNTRVGVGLNEINNLFLRRDGLNKMSTDLDLDGFKITNVQNGTNPLDVVNKQYVDRTKIGKSGGEMTGNLIFKTDRNASVSLGCNDLRDNKQFIVLLGIVANNIRCRLGEAINFNSAAGILFRLAGTDVLKYDNNSVSISKNLDMNNFYIRDVRDPRDDRDAANKFYVDSAVESVRNGSGMQTGDLDMAAHRITRIADPREPSDVTSKFYVDTRFPLPTRKYQAAYATDENSIVWKEFQEIPTENFTEDEFKSLPSGVYACYTGYLPRSRLGDLPVNTKGYLQVFSYQNGPNTWNKRYVWSSRDNVTYYAWISENRWFPWIRTISNVGDPENDGDVATKKYVDDATRRTLIGIESENIEFTTRELSIGESLLKIENTTIPLTTNAGDYITIKISVHTVGTNSIPRSSIATLSAFACSNVIDSMRTTRSDFYYRYIDILSDYTEGSPSTGPGLFLMQKVLVHLRPFSANDTSLYMAARITGEHTSYVRSISYDVYK